MHYRIEGYPPVTKVIDSRVLATCSTSSLDEPSGYQLSITTGPAQVHDPEVDDDRVVAVGDAVTASWRLRDDVGCAPGATPNPAEGLTCGALLVDPQPQVEGVVAEGLHRFG